MKYIKEILSSSNLQTVENLLKCAEEVKDQGDVFLIKMDGQRSQNEKQYTILITFPIMPSKIVRADELELKMAMLKALEEYLQVKGSE